MAKHMTLIAASGLACAIGWIARDTITADRFVVVSGRSPVAELGADANGSGRLVLRNADRTVERVYSFMPDQPTTTTTAQTQTAPSLPNPRWVMMVEEVTMLEPDHALLAEAEELETASKQMATDLGLLRQRKASLKDGDDNSQGTINRNDTRAQVSRQIAELTGELRRTKGRAAALRPAYDTPKHRITGWDGERSVELSSTKDLSALVSRLDVGVFLTWRGTFTHLDIELASYDVGQISAANRPAGFIER